MLYKARQAPLVSPNLTQGCAFGPTYEGLMPDNQSITRYREIYRKVHGVEISPEEATEQAQRFLDVARVVCQPMPKHFEKRYKELLKEHLDSLRMDTTRPADGDQESPNNL